MKLFSSDFLNKFFLLLILPLMFCTENPFDGIDEIQVKENTIRGKVLLNDGSSPEDVYVWLEGFDIGKTLDASGNFEIVLPSTDVKPYSGLTGTFKLFFYMANFKLDSAHVVIQRGKLLHNHGDINGRGELRYPVYLRKILQIEITTTPAIIPEHFDGNLFIELVLRATEDTVYIQYPNKAEGPLAILFFKDENTDPDFIKILENSLNARNAPLTTDSISVEPTVWSTGIQFFQGFLPKGNYKIIPYFLINQKSIPIDLLNDFGNRVFLPDRDYLNMPTRRVGGKLEVIKAEELP